MKRTRKPALIPSKTWRPTEEDLKVIADLKAKLGIVSESDLFRMGLRKLAESEGLNQVQ